MVARRQGREGTEHPNLGSYLEEISEDPTEYRTVSRQVDPNAFDVTAVLEHLDRRGEYPAVVFEDPLNLHGEPSGIPLVSNLWATRERCAHAVGLNRDQAGAELGARFAEMVRERHPPKIVSSDEAPVQAHVRRGAEADMWELPVVRHFEMDLSAAITMGMVMKGPGDDYYNVTFVKTFPETERRAGVTIHSQDMSRMLKAYQRRGEKIPVVNVLGHHPAFWLGTLNSTPLGDNEYETIGGFLKEPLRLAPSVTWGDDFLVPADAEILIEGEITPGDRTIVDPFGEISGQYQGQELAPAMEVTAITYRQGAMMQDVFSGHREHMLLGSIPREGSVYNHLKSKIDGVRAVHLPYSGSGRYTIYISMRTDVEWHVKNAALQAVAHVPNFQVVVVVDEDIDVFNEEQVLWAVYTYADPDRDVDIVKNLRPPSDPRGMDSKRVFIDATRPRHIPFPTRLQVPEEDMARVKLEEWLDDVEGQGGRR